MTTALRENLKTETAVVHHALEKHLSMMNEAFALPEYTRMIERWAAFHQAFEKAVAGFPEVAEFYSHRLKTPMLARDLQALSAQVHPEDEKLVKEFFAGLDLDAAALWGMCYVIEGSTHGGVFMARHFAKKFNLSPDAGVSYFGNYKEMMGPNWTGFVAKLEGIPADAVVEAKVIESASRLFTFMHDYLKPSA